MDGGDDPMRQLTGWAIVVVSVGAMAAFGGLWPLAGLGVVALSGACVALRCSHAGPLGLWPATVSDTGEPVPARWFCDRCGKSWAADFDHGRPPVQKFTGYDESKAVRSAHRATELEQRQRMLALQRAGMAHQEPKKPRISVAVARAAMNQPVSLDRRHVC
jgi:hypothetical protein